VIVHKLQLFVLLVVVAVVPRAARADTVEEAAAHFRLGQQHMEAKEFDAAAREFLRAHELRPAPVLLFNIAQAYYEGGQRREAQAYYSRYLSIDTVGPGVEIAMLRLDELTRDLGPLPEPETEPTIIVHRGGGRGLRIAGLSIGAAGLLTAGLGIYFGVRASSLADEVTEGSMGGRWSDTLELKEQDGEAAERNMYICYGVGGAAVLTGSILYYLGVRAGRTTTEVVPAPVGTTESVGLLLRGVF